MEICKNLENLIKFSFLKWRKITWKFAKKEQMFLYEVTEDEARIITWRSLAQSHNSRHSAPTNEGQI